MNVKACSKGSSNSSLIVVQARLKSTRLPGKTLLWLDGQTLIERVLEVCLVSVADCVVVSLPFSEGKSPLYHMVSQFTASVGRKAFVSFGEDENMVDRYSRAIDLYKSEFHTDLMPDWIVRVCSDRPLLATQAINDLINLSPEIGYAMNHLDLDGVPNGRGAEAIGGIQWSDFLSRGLLDRHHLSAKLQQKFLRDQVRHLGVADYSSRKLVKKEIDTLDDYLRISEFLREEL